MGNRKPPFPTDCATSGYKRVIHDPVTWRFLQDIYIETAGDRLSSSYSAKQSKYPSYSGFTVDVEVKDHGPRGRSIYAKEPIRKGTSVWRPIHLIKFYQREHLLEFLAALDHDLQCDALLWAYVEKEHGHVALALDPASFVNHGETKRVINVDGDMHAINDIAVGEEILEDYSDFIGFVGQDEELEWFHKIRGIAWNENKNGLDPAQSTNEYNLLGAPKSWGMEGGYSFDRNAELLLFPVALALWAAVVVVKKFLPSKLRSHKKEDRNERYSAAAASPKSNPTTEKRRQHVRMHPNGMQAFS